MAMLIVMTVKLMKHSMNIIGNVMIRCVLKHFVLLSAIGITDALHHNWILSTILPLTPAVQIYHTDVITLVTIMSYVCPDRMKKKLFM